MPEEKTYRIPIGKAETRLTDRGSKFLSLCAPAANEVEALEILTQRSKQHHDASHHCYAFRVGDPNNPQERYSDHGEPSGTAGRPILDQIRGKDLVGIIVIVTRWFGGTKLGKGGLVRAYGGCAADALGEVKVIVKRPMTEIVVRCDYDLIGLVEKYVPQYEGKIKGGEYQVDVVLTIHLPEIHAGELKDCLVDKSAGRIIIESSVNLS
ncbi:MAG: DUF1949 domain-containing protein [Calditrichaeota bacterium]|jgi:uncharacterized YigZ family protein|nr:DUF1949 domain-containing protein [Calditrichota bacterium]